MESMRQQKISRMLQKELADILLKESRNWSQGAMITVTKTHITRDLSIARVYVSIFSPSGVKGTFESLLSHARDIRTLLGMRVGKQLRIVPQLEFFLDDSLDYLENIEQLLKE